MSEHVPMTSDELYPVLAAALGLPADARAVRLAIVLEAGEPPRVIVELIAGAELADKTCLAALHEVGRAAVVEEVRT